MAQFIGFTCDKCNSVVDSKSRTKKTIKLEGIVNGEYHEDLCPSCVEVPENQDLKPLRRRRLTKAESAAESAPSSPLSAVGVAQTA